MEFPDPLILAYAEKLSSPENEVLSALNRETQAKILMPRMLSGHLQGRFLSMISKMIRPERILEIGTYTGYSGICLAEGLAPDGKLHTIDINEELSEMVNKFILLAGMSDRIITHTGNALEIIPALDESFDLVFIDADKINYRKYYDMVLPKVKKGGFLMADNVLWSGKVLEDKKDEDTRAIAEFNAYVLNDDKVENVLIPVRDGIMLMRKL